MMEDLHVELKPGFAFKKASFKEENNFSTSKLDLNLRT
jgi:hypothetical protein